MVDEQRHRTEEVVCREFVDLVTDYSEGALAEHRTELVEEHLVMCDWCKDYLDQLEVTIQALPAGMANEPVAPGIQRALLAAFREWSGER